MKNKSLILSLLLVLVALVSSVFGINVKAAGNESEALSIEGVQIREAEGEVVSGMRFVAEVEGYEGTAVTAYGVSIAFGEADAAAITIGATVNGKSVLSAQVSETAENKYYINMINIPTTMYGQKVTARSYVVDNGEVVYSSTAVTKCYGQAALDITAAGKDKETTKAIVAELAANYKNVFTDQFGNVNVANPVYETNPVNLEKVFVADWNAKFDTDWTEIKYSTFQASASEGNDKLDCSGSNMFAFFNDETYGAKWQWLLEYMVAVSGGFVHPARQAKAIMGDGTAYDPETGEAYDSYVASATNHMNSLMHLSASITNFFNTGKSRDTQDVLFEDSTKYAKVVDFNNIILAKDTTLVSVNSDLELADVAPAAGYQFVGYKLGETSYNDLYVVSTDDAILIPQFSAVEYSVKFFDGEEELSTLETSYTIESNEIALPEYSKEGYVFGGWYEDSTFADEPVTTIAAKSTGNKVFYAKFDESSFKSVNVTFDTNGGSWDVASLLENVTTTQKFNITVYKTYISSGSKASINTSKPATWWYYIALVETEISGLYEIKQIVSKNSNVTVDYDYVIMWHSSNGDDNMSALTAMFNGAANYVGDYVILENVPGEQSTSANIAVSVFEASELTKSVSKSLQEPETLPVVSKTGYSFIGWKSSVDETIVTEYPGYTTNPGDITYTAQWSFAGYQVTFNANDGWWGYASQAELVSDFLADAGAVLGSTLADPAAYHSNGAKANVWKTAQPAFRAKWIWMMKYIKEVGGSSIWTTENEKYINTTIDGTNISGYAVQNVVLVLLGTNNATATAAVADGGYGLSGFASKATCVDFTAQVDGYWSKYLAPSSEMIDGTALPTNLYKPGYTFAGWYTTSTFDAGTEVTTVSGNATVYAKWQANAQ